jgi:hypothetical protein
MSSPTKSPKNNNGTKKNSSRKNSPSKRMLDLLGQHPIKSSVNNYLNKPAGNIVKLVKQSAPNGNLSRTEILKRENKLQTLAMFTKNIKNAKNAYNHRQTHKLKRIQRLLTNANLLVDDIRQYNRPIHRSRLLAYLDELRRLGVNESILEEYRNI